MVYTQHNLANFGWALLGLRACYLLASLLKTLDYSVFSFFLRKKVKKRTCMSETSKKRDKNTKNRPPQPPSQPKKLAHGVLLTGKSQRAKQYISFLYSKESPKTLFKSKRKGTTVVVFFCHVFALFKNYNTFVRTLEPEDSFSALYPI